MENEEDFEKDREEKNYKYGAAPYIILLIGLMTVAAQFFGYMESQLLNTYIAHVLRLNYIYIGIMVSFSATMGLIFLFVWGIISDNTRNHRFGRRAPYLLIGGIGSGIGMILFGYSENYFWCFFLDVVIIGIFSNCFYAAQRVLVPDLIDIEYRGRVNSIIGVFTILGIVAPVALTLVANAQYTIPNPNGPGNILTQEGHIFLLAIGGLFIIISGLIGFIFIRDNVSVADLPPKKKFKEEINETFSIEEIKTNKEFFKLILATTIFMSGVSAALSYLINFLLTLGLDNMGLITVIGIAAPILIVAIFALGILTYKLGRKTLIPPTIIISSIGFFMIIFITQTENVNVVMLGIAFALILLGIIGVLIPMNTWSQDLLPEDKRAQYFGIFNIVNTLSQVIGALTAAFVISYFEGKVYNHVAMLFLVVPFFFLLSIPFFLRVQETLPEEFREIII